MCAYMLCLYNGGIFFFGNLLLFFWSGCVLGLAAFGSLAFRPGFGFLVSLASWFFGFWLLGNSPSYSFLVLYGLLLLGFLSFLAFRPLGFLASRLLTASCIILDYVTM